MAITITRDLNVVSVGVPPVIHLSQYDSDFTLVFNLYASTGAFTMPTGTTAEIRGTKRDGNGYDAAASVSGSTVTVTGDEQMTAIAGQNMFEIATYYNNKRLNTINFILDVERAALDADTITSESVLRELDAIIQGAATATQAAEDAEDAADRAEEAADDLSGTVQQVATNTQDIAGLKDDLEQIVPGLSEEAKVALLDCFAHVAWIDEYGQDYYDALEEALNPEPPAPDPTLIYTISNASFNGVDQMINTDLSYLNNDVDWTILLDVTDEVQESYVITPQKTPIIFNTMLAGNPWPGIQFVRRHDPDLPHRFVINLWNKGYYFTVDDSTVPHRVKVAVVHQAGTAPVFLISLFDGNNTLVDSNPSRVFSFTTVPSTFTLTLGNAMDERTGDNRGFWWHGTINKLNIYNRVLTLEEATRILI